MISDGTATVVRILHGTSTGMLTEGQTITPLNNGAAQKLANADMTGDGRPDLIAADDLGDALSILIQR